MGFLTHVLFYFYICSSHEERVNIVRAAKLNVACVDGCGGGVQ